MNQSSSVYRIPTSHLWLVVAVLASLLIACGGGGDGGSTSAGVGSGGTGASFSGPITGFGSIIVNGVRLDDSSATITLDDDSSARDQDLKLGMVIQADGERDAGGTTGKATSITARSFVQGPIAAIDAVNKQLTVLGVTVTVTPGTVFDGSTGLDALGADDTVEIHGIASGPRTLKATRIEKKTGTGEVRLTGTLQSTSAGTYAINDIPVQFLPALPSGVASGMLVRIKGTLNNNGSGIVAGNVQRVTLTPQTSEGKEAEIEGIVTKFDTVRSFELNGLPVSVPGTVTIDGTPALGARAEVEGRIVNGTLVASKVEVRNDAVEDDDANEFHGAVGSLDIATKTFALRDGTVTVKWDANTAFDASSLPKGAGSLVTGLKVEVKGKVSGNALLATYIKLDN
jgi:hypothetical protein